MTDPSPSTWNIYSSITADPSDATPSDIVQPLASNDIDTTTTFLDGVVLSIWDDSAGSGQRYVYGTTQVPPPSIWATTTNSITADPSHATPSDFLLPSVHGDMDVTTTFQDGIVLSVWDPGNDAYLSVYYEATQGTQAPEVVTVLSTTSGVLGAQKVTVLSTTTISVVPTSSSTTTSSKTSSTPSPTAPSSAPSLAPPPVPTHNPAKKDTAIAVGTVVPIVAILCLLAAAFFIRRRRKRNAVLSGPGNQPNYPTHPLDPNKPVVEKQPEAMPATTPPAFRWGEETFTSQKSEQPAPIRDLEAQRSLTASPTSPGPKTPWGRGWGGR